MAEKRRNPFLIAIAVFILIAAGWIIFGMVVGGRAS